MKHIISVSFSRTNAYDSHKEFLAKFLNVSFGHYLLLSSNYVVHICNNAGFESDEYELGLRWQFTNLHSPIALYKLHREYVGKDAVFIIHGFHTPLHVLFLKLFQPSARLIVLHHAERPAKHPIKRALQRMAFYQSKALFVSTEQSKTFVEQKILQPNLVHEVMECSTTFTPGEQLAYENVWRCLWVGRLDRNKDPLTVLRAMALLKTKGVAVRLEMVYSGGKQESIVKQTIQDLGLSQNVILRGYKSHKKLATIFCEHHLFLSASYYEGSGVAACEAMATGCVPILTNIPSFRKMTIEGKAGYLYKPGQFTELTDIIAQLSPKEWLSKRDACLEVFNQNLSFPAMAKRYSEIIESDSV